MFLKLPVPIAFRKLVRNANSWALPHLLNQKRRVGPAISVLTSSPAIELSDLANKRIV